MKSLFIFSKTIIFLFYTKLRSSTVGELYLDKIDLACAEEWKRTHPFPIVIEQPLFASRQDEQNGEETRSLSEKVIILALEPG